MSSPFASRGISAVPLIRPLPGVRAASHVCSCLLLPTNSGLTQNNEKSKDSTAWMGNASKPIDHQFPSSEYCSFNWASAATTSRKYSRLIYSSPYPSKGKTRCGMQAEGDGTRAIGEQPGSRTLRMSRSGVKTLDYGRALAVSLALVESILKNRIP